MNATLTPRETVRRMSRVYLARRRPLILVLLVSAGSLCGILRARDASAANPTADDKALATILFQEGRAMMAAGRIPEACSKLEESQRLDPGGGTLLNLALCHEHEGRLARSWSEFKEAEVVARGDGRGDREGEATSQVRALEPRLSRLTIVVPASAQVEGLVIERDGREVGRGAWSTAIPVDGGAHVIRATALGREPFRATVVIAPESDARTVEIPVLATPVVVVAPARVDSPQLAAPPVAPWLTPTRLRHGGIVVASVGVVLLGAAGYALKTALRAKDASNGNCFVDGCNDVGLQKRADAVSRGNLATVLGTSGIVLVGAGATLFYLGRRGSAPPREGQVPARFTLGVAPGALFAGIGGGF